MDSIKSWLARSGMGSVLILALIIIVVFPLTMDLFRLNLVGKYLTYAFVAVGLVMLWGYGGVLSLGQGVFFGLGGYMMAMFMKLEASDPETTKIQSTPGIPDFMDWNQLTELPLWWEPFRHLPLALMAVVLVPTLLAFIISFAMFRRRVGGVYFAIITQAVCLILTVLIIGQQGYTGGVNGITDLKTMLGWDTRTDSAKYILYFVNAGLLIAAILLCRWIQLSKLGTLLLAMRDKEDRVRFSGYDVSMFKVLPSASPRCWPQWAVRCSRCRSVSCRRRWSASSPPSKWSSSPRSAGACRWSVPCMERCWSISARPTSPKASPTSGCS